MVKANYVFCTECGVKNYSKNLFCTDCGFTISNLNIDVSLDQPRYATQSIPPVSIDIGQKVKGRRFLRVFFVCLFILALGVSAGATMTAQGFLEGIFGERLTKKESEKLQNIANEEGYRTGLAEGFEKGEAAGIARGKDVGFGEGKATGLREGFEDGCNSVFDRIGEHLIAIRYPWYDSSIYGFYWGRSAICN